MSFWKAVLAAFVGGVLAGVFILAYRVSQETQKSLPESFADVPAEAKRVYVGVKSKATDAVHRAREHGAEGEEGVEMGWADTGLV
jgi:hypothetical protein